MNSILQWLYTCIVWIYCAFAFISHFIIFLLLFPLSKLKLIEPDSQWMSIQCSKPFLKFGFWAFNFPLEIRGQDNLPKSAPMILVSNHQSHLDILIIQLSVPRKIAFVAKKELSRVPILGWDITLQGHITIDRNDRKKAMSVLEKLAHEIRDSHKSVLLFPEGTRSLTGKIGEFKKGAFILAQKTKAPLIPAAIHGSINVLSKKSLKMKPGKMIISFGKPIFPNSNTPERDEITRLSDESKQSIENLYSELKASL